VNDLFNLLGNVAIITGGNGGIGKGIARGLASMESDIVIAARNQDKTNVVIEEIKKEFGVQCIGVQVDVKQEEQIQGMVEKAVSEFGKIDILVNNAGISDVKLPQDYTLSEWDEVLHINLRGSFLCSKAVYPGMKSGGGGKIICLGSMYSIFGGALSASYAASKGGVVQLTRSLAVAWAKDNIQVNAILPGWITSDMTIPIQDAAPEWSESIVTRTPSHRWGEPNDVAGAVIFLASRASDFITGVALPVDGGFSVMG